MIPVFGIFMTANVEIDQKSSLAISINTDGLNV